jgi:small-conductance mechanosensitive channel
VDAFVQTVDGWIRAALTHEWAWRILIGLALAIVGAWLAGWLARILDRLMRRFAVEDILRNFLRNLAYAIALVIAFIAALDFAGVPTTSLLAVVGAAGLAIGLALKDSLSNIASGVMLIVLRPFHTGDSVQIAGLEGVVESVRIFHTTMVTADNREIILPNSQITASPIINYTGRGERRVDIPMAMAFGDDLKLVRESLLALAARQSRVKALPKPEVLVTALGESTVSVQLRVWVDARDYNAAQAELMEAVLNDFATRGMRIPLPQRELHVHHHGVAADTLDGMQKLVKPAL